MAILHDSGGGIPAPQEIFLLAFHDAFVFLVLYRGFHGDDTGGALGFEVDASGACTPLSESELSELSLDFGSDPFYQR